MQELIAGQVMAADFKNSQRTSEPVLSDEKRKQDKAY